MRAILCHVCWTWVFPSGTQCAECHHPLDWDEADPDPAEMGERLGRVLVRLAGVRWERRRLPQTGWLWGTTTGLLFWPFLERQPSGAWAETSFGNERRGWSLFPRWRSTVALPAWSEAAPTGTLQETGAALGERYFDTPGGALFLRDDLVGLQLRGKTLTLSRSIGRTLKLTLLTPRETTLQHWPLLTQADPAWLALGRLR